MVAFIAPPPPNFAKIIFACSWVVFAVFTGVIVAGPPGSGKSSCVQTLVDALSLSNQGGTSRQSQTSRTTGNLQENQHKLIKINPMVVDDCSLMFGYLNVNSDWVDGIFTSACRKANRVSSMPGRAILTHPV